MLDSLSRRGKRRRKRESRRREGRGGGRQGGKIGDLYNGDMKENASQSNSNGSYCHDSWPCEESHGHGKSCYGIPTCYDPRLQCHEQTCRHQSTTTHHHNRRYKKHKTQSCMPWTQLILQMSTQFPLAARYIICMHLTMHNTDYTWVNFFFQLVILINEKAAIQKTETRMAEVMLILTKAKHGHP